MSKQRTYEIITKYIGKNSGVRVVLQEGATPVCDIEKKIITLPARIKDENIYPALCEAIHEAGHVRMTDMKINNLADNTEEHSVLNAFEDIRVDKSNMDMLPGIPELYTAEYEFIKANKSKNSMPVGDQALCNTIFEIEGYGQYADHSDPVVSELTTKLKGYGLGYLRAVDRSDWKTAKTIIKDATNLVGGANAQKKQQQQNQDPSKPCKEGKGGKAQAAGGGQGNSKESPGTPQAKPAPKDVLRTQDIKDKIFSAPGGGWEGHSDANKSGVECVAMPMSEITKQKLATLLSIKERMNVSEETGKLDTDNLSAYMTGDIGELFKDERIERKHKSKILILCDVSGSMGAQLMDGECRDMVLLRTTKSIVNSIEEIRDTEGVNVDYDVVLWDDQYHPQTKEGWEENSKTMGGGGTRMLTAIEKAQDQIIADIEVTGKKLILLITDGEVSPNEIQKAQEIIMMKNSDVRVVLVGIGVDIAAEDMFKRNIHVEEEADEVLMEAISDMIE